MSGEKEVRLREHEYNRLMNAARRVESSNQHASSLRRQLEAAEQKINQNAAAAAQREEAFTRMVNNLGEDLQQATREYDKRLRQQKKAFDQSLDQVNKRIDNQEQAHQELADYTRSMFAKIEQKETRSQDYAKKWLNDGRHIIDYIDQHQQHEKFAPGKLAELRVNLDLAEKNFANGEFSAATSMAQTTYLNALQLNAAIELRQSEWDSWFIQVRKDVAALLAGIDSQEIAQWVIDTEYESVQLDAEINYWSEGKLAEFKKQIEEKKEYYERNAAVLTLANLKEESATLKQATQELETIAQEAKKRQFSSVLRANIAQDIADALKKQGWTVAEGVWEGCDTDEKGGLKNGYHCKLKDVADNEIISIVTPDTDSRGELTNTVRFAYFPKNSNDTRFAQNQTQAINTLLQNMGVADGALRCSSGHETTTRGMEQRRDLSKVRTMTHNLKQTRDQR